ncbi:hypothetical protein BDR07DRAFT_1381315 [Suillus spraguei]|nr:hypothetical protein BDR07DRAFT_1381315 [Suillus spraguei]
MACPPTYKTEEARQAASRERHHYAKQCDLRIIKPSQEIQEIEKALAEALGYDEDDTTTSEIKTSDDENNLSGLPECLIALKNIRDEMLELVQEPCAFTEGILMQYVKSLLDDGYSKGDTSIVKTTKAKIEGLLRRATPTQDLIRDFCGVSDQSRAAESLVRQTLDQLKSHIQQHNTFKNATMVGTVWVTAEQKAFLQELYIDFLKVQLQATVMAFWTEVYHTWFEKWPEISIMYPSVPDQESLTEEQNKLLGIVINKRHQKMLGNKVKGTRVHTPAEIFAKSSHGADIHNQLRDAIDSGSIMSKGEKLNTARKLAKEAYISASPEVQASCIAAVQAECDAKASEVIKQKRAPDERKNSELATALEECTGPIAHFLQAIHDLMGFHWLIMGAGPDPHYNSDINAISYHTGINEQGQNWMQATPDFNKRHLKPFTTFVFSISSASLVH